MSSYNTVSVNSVLFRWHRIKAEVIPRVEKRLNMCHELGGGTWHGLSAFAFSAPNHDVHARPPFLLHMEQPEVSPWLTFMFQVTASHSDFREKGGCLRNMGCLQVSREEELVWFFLRQATTKNTIEQTDMLPLSEFLNLQLHQSWMGRNAA